MLPATGGDTYWNFILPVPIHETRWVRAVEIRPGDKRLVHHANILVDRYESARRMEKDKGSGFGGMEVRIESEVFDPDSHFLFWKPGTVVSNEPDGMALRLDKGTDLVLNTHLQPSGKVEAIQPSIGLYFTDKPATVHPMLLQMQNDAALDIPAGEKNFVVTDEFTLPHRCGSTGHLSARALSRQGYAGDGVTARWNDQDTDSHEAVGPQLAGGLSLCGAGFSPQEHGDSRCATCTTIPRTTRPIPIIRLRACREAIARRMRWRTFGCRYCPRTIRRGPGDPRMILQEAWARHEVEKAPGVFESHYNLGEMLQARGALDEAVEQFQVAVSDPSDGRSRQQRPGRSAARQRGREPVRYNISTRRWRRNPTILMRITTWRTRWPRKAISAAQPSNSANP